MGNCSRCDIRFFTCRQILSLCKTCAETELKQLRTANKELVEALEEAVKPCCYHQSQKDWYIENLKEATALIAKHKGGEDG